MYTVYCILFLHDMSFFLRKNMCSIFILYVYWLLLLCTFCIFAMIGSIDLLSARGMNSQISQLPWPRSREQVFFSQGPHTPILHVWMNCLSMSPTRKSLLYINKLKPQVARMFEKRLWYGMMLHHNQRIIPLARIWTHMLHHFTLQKGCVDPNIKKHGYFGNVASKFSSVVMYSCDFRSMYSIYDQTSQELCL